MKILNQKKKLLQKKIKALFDITIDDFRKNYSLAFLSKDIIKKYNINKLNSLNRVLMLKLIKKKEKLQKKLI